MPASKPPSITSMMRLLTAIEILYCGADRRERCHERSLQLLARGAQGNAAVRPIEEAQARASFQTFDGMTERGCADAEFQRGSAETAMLRNREEVGEVCHVGAPELHC
jgi:hypothetical protein